MHTLGEIAAVLNRSSVYLSGLQKRFELPVAAGPAYSDAYLSFLRTVVFLRTLNVGEEALRDLWHLEKKLLNLLHVESTGSPTWCLDSCGSRGHTRRRLLLSHYDLGFDLHARKLQLGLNFSEAPRELFAGKEMGEDALRVLGDYLKLYHRLRQDAQAERPLLREALVWVRGMH